MIDPTRTGWRTRLIAAGAAATLALIALAALPPAAQARVWVSAGGPFPGYYYSPGPYYGYAPPYYYAPQSGYYALPGYYPPPDAYPPTGLASSAYAPPAAPAPAPYAPQSAGIAPQAPTSGASSAAPKVTYTSKPAFTNAAGQTCREYKATDTTNNHPVDVFGTACRQDDGQWRVVN